MPVPRAVRLACVDIGSNTTRLLVAEIDDDAVWRELMTQRAYTLIGKRADKDGTLPKKLVADVAEVVSTQVRLAREMGADDITIVATAAVRAAPNKDKLLDKILDRTDISVRVLSGHEEAQLAFIGATKRLGAPAEGTIVVIDVGGGSTELVVGTAAAPPSFHVSLQAGVVRQTERHLRHDPPQPAELQALADEVRALVDAHVPADVRARVRQAVGVAGTATSLAAIDQELEPYDPSRVHGAVVERGSAELLLARLAQMPLAARRAVRGLHPDRAPTIVAGVVILLEVLRAVDLPRLEVSEHDLLHGVALERAAR